MLINKLIKGLPLVIVPLVFFNSKTDDKREYYQLVVYHFKDSTQERTIDQYLQAAYIPALHKKKARSVGVFKPIANDTALDKKIYVLIPFKNLEEIKDLPDQLLNDKDYLQSANEYLEAPGKNAPYQRIENILLYAFRLSPQMHLPKFTSPKNDRIYELRSYESATEKLYRSKVKMFNEGGEIALFRRLNFNAIFYAEVIAGDRMPNLMYMTSFENREQRDAHWKDFSGSTEWKNLTAMPEYQNNVSKADVILTKPASYSDY